MSFHSTREKAGQIVKDQLYRIGNPENITNKAYELKNRINHLVRTFFKEGGTDDEILTARNELAQVLNKPYIK